MYKMTKKLAFIVVLFLPAISYGQGDVAWRMDVRPFPPQQEALEMIQKSREIMQVQMNDARIKNQDLMQQMRDQLQMQKKLLQNGRNNWHSRIDNEPIPDDRLGREWRIAPSDRGSNAWLEHDDPFLKEMRDEQRQLKDSATPNSFNIPDIQVWPVVPDGAMIPMPSVELDQLRARLEAIRPELDQLRDSMRPYYTRPEAFREYFDLQLPIAPLVPMDVFIPDAIMP